MAREKGSAYREEFGEGIRIGSLAMRRLITHSPSGKSPHCAENPCFNAEIWIRHEKTKLASKGAL